MTEEQELREAAEHLSRAQAALMATVLAGSPVELYEDSYNARETAIENIERVLARREGRP